MPLFSSVTTEKSSPLERSRGRVHLIGGDFYYSPNSQRDVQLPLVYNDIPFRNCFKDSFAEFRQPLWWQPACPYLAFVSLRPNFAGVPFQDLFHISYFPRLRYGGFMIDPQIILGWARLEKDIRDAVNLLLVHERAPAIAWLVPTTLGCQGVFNRVHTLRTQFKDSKEWFSLLMGALSYAIAVSITHHQEIFDEPMPHWFSFLSQRDFSQIWLSGLRSSMVAYFDSCIDRIGAFVQLCQHHRDQFSVDWLCEYGILGAVKKLEPLRLMLALLVLHLYRTSFKKKVLSKKYFLDNKTNPTTTVSINHRTRDSTNHRTPDSTNYRTPDWCIRL
jgi:hypothetical protein